MLAPNYLNTASATTGATFPTWNSSWYCLAAYIDLQDAETVIAQTTPAARTSSEWASAFKFNERLILTYLSAIKKIGALKHTVWGPCTVRPRCYTTCTTRHAYATAAAAAAVDTVREVYYSTHCKVTKSQPTPLGHTNCPAFTASSLFIMKFIQILALAAIAVAAVIGETTTNATPTVATASGTSSGGSAALSTTTAPSSGTTATSTASDAGAMTASSGSDASIEVGAGSAVTDSTIVGSSSSTGDVNAGDSTSTTDSYARQTRQSPSRVRVQPALHQARPAARHR
ncbi:unnamed protein product [Phytophthora fragariaefolia]|uniref:Unnamed protein product n=1 Tax=Phytophthora fragariaefolia TaxID=1490495 RepID=A0A9W6XMB1_9STRA|nr:unnamed protein product [Phytophthora fragariaefolia]